MKLIKHHLDEVIDFTIPVSSSELPTEDKTQIMAMILKHWISHNSVFSYFPGEELLSLDWTWLDSERRTLNQRIVYVLKKYKANMTPAFYGKMGNKIRETIPTAPNYLFDYTRTFDWKSGQFGDGRSCFMNGGARTGVLKEMNLNGSFYAMRFFQREPVVNHNNMINLANTIPKYVVGDKKYFGRARTFIHYRELTVRKGSKLVEEPVYFMFNSYGKESLREMAAVLAAYVGASFRSVILRNIGKACGGLYLNSGSMIIGNPRVIQNIEKFDFKFKTTYDEKERQRELGLGQAEIPNPWHHGVQVGLQRRRRVKHSNCWGTKKLYWYKNPTNKKTRSTDNKRRTHNEIELSSYYLLQDIMREWFWISSWKGKAFEALLRPTSKVRGSWKLLYWRYNQNFYQILIKLIQIKNNGGFNGNSLKSKNPEQYKTKCSKPTLRRNEADQPVFNIPIDLIIADEGVQI